MSAGEGRESEGGEGEDCAEHTHTHTHRVTESPSVAFEYDLNDFVAKLRGILENAPRPAL